MVEARIVKAGDEVRRAGAGGGDTDAKLAGELRMRGRHERGHLFVAYLYEFDFPLGSPERAKNAVNAVTGITKNAAHAPGVKPLDEDRSSIKPRRGRPKKQAPTARIKIAEQESQAIYAEFHSPSIADRERVAMYLAKFVVRGAREPSSNSGDEDEFARLCANRAAQAREDASASIGKVGAGQAET